MKKVAKNGRKVKARLLFIQIQMHDLFSGISGMLILKYRS